jgi:hypothetical protein
VERDGEGYRFDLGQVETEIFLQMGLDNRFTDLPVRQRFSVPWGGPSQRVARMRAR